jgi:hypothetical protein
VNQNSAVLGTRHRVIVIAGWYKAARDATAASESGVMLW